ncbi:MAG: YihY/virulence factor BrkB family protein [Chloroflexota bacterium]|nr:MAG: YihY/virulence factor BrkB family protein [Chloroflexota bacterium]
MLKEFWLLLKDTISEWTEDKAPRLAAALSYYTLFSLPPFLVIIIAVAGLIVGSRQAEERLIQEIQGVTGAEAAGAVESLIQGAGDPGEGILASVISIAILIVAATGLFGQLQDALNTIWEVTPNPKRGLLTMIRSRFFSFTLVIGVAFLLLVSLVVSTVLTALGNFFTSLLPETRLILQAANFLASFAIITLLFAIIFKYLPEATVAWRDVWLGAAVTAFLFTVGKSLIGLYLGTSAVTSTYGAAGSLVVIMIWVYYSAQIFFFGAEFTQVYARRRGAIISPEAGAVALTEEDRRQQGMPRLKRDGSLQLREDTPASTTVISYRNEREAVPANKPARRSMLALGAITMTLVSFVGAVLVRKIHR